jgi:ankyrin repeat protein
VKIKSGELVVLGIWTGFAIMAVYIALWLFGDQPAALRAAAYRGDTQRVRSILERRPEWVNMRDKYDMTALHQAMSRMNEETVHVLLEKGASINATNYNGATPLHLAAGVKDVPTDQQKRVLEMLLNKGADLSLKDNHGRSAVEMVDTNSRNEVAVWLRQRGK